MIVGVDSKRRDSSRANSGMARLRDCIAAFRFRGRYAVDDAELTFSCQFLNIMTNCFPGSRCNSSM